MTRKKYKKLMYAYLTKDYLAHNKKAKDRIAIFYRAIRNCKVDYTKSDAYKPDYNYGAYQKAFDYLTGGKM